MVLGLLEVEKQCFGLFGGGESQGSSILGAGPITRGQRQAIKRKHAFSDLNPCGAALAHLMSHTLSRRKEEAVDVHVLVNRRRPIATIR